MTVDSTVLIIRARSIFTPLARANSGFEPTAVNAVPVRVFINTFIIKKQIKTKRISPVGNTNEPI